MHITSTKFDEPILVQMIKTYPFSISIHGYKSDRRHTLVGGTNEKMQEAVVRELKDRGFSAELVQKASASLERIQTTLIIKMPVAKVSS